MLIHKSFRFRIYLGTEQVALLDAWSDALRFLWNLANEQRLIGLARRREERRYYTAFDQINQLTELRAELPWLAAVPRNVCAQLLVQLDKAWRRCFDRIARQPKWKRKGRDVVSPCEPHPKGWRLSADGLHFPKLGLVRTVQHRQLEGTLKTCTIARDADQWFAAITSEIEVPTPTPRTEPVVGLDRGCVNLVADSDGNIVANPRYLTKSLRRLARAQRTVSRRKKGSHNRAKAKLRVARLHRKVRRQRDHVLHQLSHDYANSHGTVVVENLNVVGMSAEGGAHKTGLNRSILSAGWGKLCVLLGYKLAWSGGQLATVPAAYSSQECSVCGVVDPSSRASQSEFCCTACGHVEHADTNAAKVLKLRYLCTRANRSGLPAEGSVPKAARRSRKWLNSSMGSPKSSAL